MKWIYSRTIWTLVFMFVFNGWTAISGEFDPNIALVVNAILAALAGYFRIEARVK